MNNSHKIFLTQEYEKNIPENIRRVLNLCAKAADELNLPIFIIGGSVRDIILGKTSFDTDITVQGNAIKFAHFIDEKYLNCTLVETHHDFGTAKVVFEIGNEKIPLDIASTRKESYKEPAALPTIEEIACPLYDDVIRRDFTINTMAMRLNNQKFGELIDYLGGYQDLKDKKLRILHENSFIDDPTRIIRGLKFAVRFGFALEENSSKLQAQCLNGGQFDNLGSQRVKSELKQTFNLNNPACLERFISENIFRLVNSRIKIENFERIYEIPKIVSEYENIIAKEDIWLIYLGYPLLSLEEEEIKTVCASLNLTNHEIDILLGAKKLSRKNISDKTTRYALYKLLIKYPIEPLLINIVANYAQKPAIDLFINELKGEKTTLTGQKLIEMGVAQGPDIGKILEKVLEAKLEKKIFTEEEERSLVKDLL